MFAQAMPRRVPPRWLLLSIPLLLAVLVAEMLHSHPQTAVVAASGPVVYSAPPLIVSASPGQVDAENTFVISGIQARAVRVLSSSLDMNMGILTYAARSLGNGRWRVVNADVPMLGRWGIDVQAWHAHGWVTVARIAYQVPFSGTMHLLSTP